MRTFEFDDNGDWTLEMVSGKDEILQSISHSLKTRLGEWFLDESIGLSRVNLQSKVYKEKDISYDIIEAIKQDERVVDVSDIRLDYDRRSRLLKIEVEIQAEVNDNIERMVLNVAI